MPGEVLGLVGDNGAGKTTLVKCIAGVHRADAGEIHVDGELRRNLDADSARSLGIETVHQNLSLVDTLDVAQNFFLNRELVHGKLGTGALLDEPARDVPRHAQDPLGVRPRREPTPPGLGALRVGSGR